MKLRWGVLGLLVLGLLVLVGCGVDDLCSDRDTRGLCSGNYDYDFDAASAADAASPDASRAVSLDGAAGIDSSATSADDAGAELHEAGSSL